MKKCSNVTVPYGAEDEGKRVNNAGVEKVQRKPSAHRKRTSVLLAKAEEEAVKEEDQIRYGWGGLAAGNDAFVKMMTIEEATATCLKDGSLFGFTFTSSTAKPVGEVLCYFKNFGTEVLTDPEWHHYIKEDFHGHWSCCNFYQSPVLSSLSSSSSSSSVGSGQTSTRNLEYQAQFIMTFRSGLMAVKLTGDPLVPAGRITWKTDSVPLIGESCPATMQVRDQVDSDYYWEGAELKAINKDLLLLTLHDGRKALYRREYRPPLSTYSFSELRRTLSFNVLGETRRGQTSEENPYNVTDTILCCIHPQSSFRCKMVEIIDNVWFDRVVLLLIVLNGLMLVLDDPVFRDVGWLQTTLEVSELTFQVLFTLEAVMKILALGFVMHSGSYLRSYPSPVWNRLDFVIVVSGFITHLQSSGNFTVLRLLRCLRPLRTMNRVKELRQLMATLTAAVPLAIDIFLLFFLLMWVFAILGIQLFSGNLHQRCYLEPGWNATGRDFSGLHSDHNHETDIDLPANSSLPWLVFNDTEHCTLGDYGRQCSTNGVALPQACMIVSDVYRRRVMNFDNIFTSLLLTFKLMSLDDWPEDMKDIQDTTGHHAWVYFFLCTLIGNVFAVNLILAVLSSVYSEAREQKLYQPRPVIMRLSPVTLLSASVVHPLLIFAMPVLVEETLLEEDNTEVDFDDSATLIFQDSDDLDVMSALGLQSRLSSKKRLLSILPPSTQAPGGGPGNTNPDGESDVPAFIVSAKSLHSAGTGGTTTRPPSEVGSEVGSVPMDTIVVHMVSMAGHKVEEVNAPPVTNTATSSCVDRSSPRALNNHAEPLDEVQEHALKTPVDLPGSVEERKRRSEHERWKRLRVKGWWGRGTVGRLLFRVAIHKAFNMFMTVVTVVNILALAMDHYRIDSTWLVVINFVNFVSAYIFLGEAVLKLVGLTPAVYFTDRYNSFDLLLVLLSIPELVSPDPQSGSSGLTALRGFRLARVFRLARKWKGLNQILWQISCAVVDVAYLSVIKLLFLFIYSIMGVQLFACDSHEDIRCGFENLGQSVLTVFTVITGENWGAVMKETILANSFAAAAYFITLFLFGNYIILNLFIAILIESFASNQRTEKRTAAPDPMLGWFQCFRPRKVSKGGNSKEKSKSDMVTEVEEQTEPVSSTGALKSPPMDSLQSPPENGALPERTIPDLLRQPVRSPPAIPQQYSSATSDTAKGPFFADSLYSTNQGLMELHNSAGGLETVGTESEMPTVKGASAKSLPRVEEKEKMSPTLFSSAMSSRKASRRLSVFSMSNVHMQKKAKMVAGQSSMFRREDSNVGLHLLPTLELEDLRFADFHRESFKQWARRKLKELLTPQMLDDDERTFRSHHQQRPCWRIPMEAPIRRWARTVVDSGWFDIVVLCIIITSLVFISLDSPRAPEATVQVLRVGDIIFVLLFAMEMLLKVTAWGFMGFFGDVWNSMDAFVVITSAIGLFVPTMRGFRSLRILRLVTSGSPEMKVVLTAVTGAIPSIRNVIVVCTMMWFIFATVGVQFFKGALYHCTNPAIQYQDDCHGEFNSSVRTAFGEEPVVLNATWVSEWFTFDDIFESMFTLFQVSVGEKWREMMYRTMDAPGAGEGPRKNSNIPAAIFYVVFVVLGQFFFVNLFIGVLIQSFHTLKRERGEGVLTSERQRNWLQAQRVLLHCDLRDGLIAVPAYIESSWILEWVHYVVSLPQFEAGATLMIVLNSVVMALQHWNQPKSMDHFLNIANWVFVVIFTIEAIMKIVAFSVHYFEDGWNRFDFTIVVISWVATIFSTASTSTVRVLRIGRMLRLLGRAEGLKSVVRTLVSALPSLVNVAMLLFVVFFIFGVFGVEQFGTIAESENLNRWSNFEDLYHALVTLYQVSTTESWNDVMRGTTFHLPGCEERGDCGVNTATARAYFALFLLLGSFIFLNLFIYVLIDHFESEKQARRLRQVTRDLEAFDQLTARWLEEDPEGTGMVRADACIRILRGLPEPLWLRSPFSIASIFGSNMKRISEFLLEQKQLRSMLIPLNSDLECRYSDVVRTLSLKIFSIDIDQAIDPAQLGQQRFDPKYWSIHHYHAVRYVIYKWHKYRLKKEEEKYQNHTCPIRKAIEIIREYFSTLEPDLEEVLTRRAWVAQAFDTTAPPPTPLRGGSTDLPPRGAVPYHLLKLKADFFASNRYDGSAVSVCKHGHGLQVVDGVAKKGEWVNDFLEGPGIWGDCNEGFIYQGDFQRGCPHGLGVVDFYHGVRVVGIFDGSFRPKGKGIIVTKNDKVSGVLERWHDDQLPYIVLEEDVRDDMGRANGLCQILLMNGDTYDGEMSAGLIEGEGVMRVNSRTPREIHRGIFQDGMLLVGTKEAEGSPVVEHVDLRLGGFRSRLDVVKKQVYFEGLDTTGSGEGRVVKYGGEHHRNEQEWRGVFVNWTMEGKGEKIFADGTHSSGRYKDGKLNGFGKLEYPNTGVVFEGHFSDNKAMGWGKLLYTRLPIDESSVDEDELRQQPPPSTLFPAKSLQSDSFNSSVPLRRTGTIRFRQVPQRPAPRDGTLLNAFFNGTPAGSPRGTTYHSETRSSSALSLGDPCELFRQTPLRPPSNPLTGLFQHGMLWTGPTIIDGLPHGTGTAYLQSGAHFEGDVEVGYPRRGKVKLPEGKTLEGEFEGGFLIVDGMRVWLF